MEDTGREQHLLLMILADSYRRFHLCITKGGGGLPLPCQSYMCLVLFREAFLCRIYWRQSDFFYIYLPEQLIEYHLSLDFKTIFVSSKRKECLLLAWYYQISLLLKLKLLLVLTVNSSGLAPIFIYSLFITMFISSFINICSIIL